MARKRPRAKKRAKCACTWQVKAIQRILKRPDWEGADMLQEIYDIVHPRKFGR
jgi:hypothetical protein